MRFLKNLILVLFLVCWGGIAAAENGATFLVYPSEDLTGETDWFNVMQAFEDAKAAGAGSSVELAAGTFYIPRPLQVANFSGTLRGVGKGKTILRNAPGILFGLLEPPLEPMPAFMVFWLDGMDPSSETFWPANQIQDLTLSGFTILIDGPSERWYSHCEPAHPGWQFINFIDVRGRWTGLQHGIWDMHPDDIMEQALVNIMFEHLELIGNNGYGNNGTQVWGEGVTFACGDGPAFDWAYNKLISGTHVVEDCSYDSVSHAIAFYDLVNSTVLVGGTPDSGVTVRNSFQPLLLWDLSNSSVHASHIDSTDSLGVALYNGIDTALYGLPEIRLPEPSDYVFRHNRIRQRAGSESASFDLWNLAGYFGRALGGVDISHNYIHSVDHIFPFGPILGDFVDGAVITNNRITGRGDTAIAIEPFGNPGRDWVLVGNNLQGFESTPYPEQILLGPETSNCIVVGGSNKTNVFDLGTDNHIVGVSNSGWARELPLGIRISEAIQLRNKR